MTGGERFALAIAAMCSFMAAVWILAFQLIDQHDCRYFVPVAKHPGVYTCSAHPRPFERP